MANDLYKTGIFNTPAQASADMTSFLSSTTNGQSILSAAAYPKRNFPSADSLGINDSMLDNSAKSVFPFKNNNVALTDIEVPTTILVLGGTNLNQIQYQTNKFILQSIIKPQQERFQIIETFGEPALYFYDKRTRIYTIQGLLFDAEDPTQKDNTGINDRAQALKGANYWATAFQDFYEQALRGTILVQKKWIAAMYVNNWFIKGYPLQLTLTKSAESLPQTVGFQMTWAIKSETLLSSKAAQSLWSKNRFSKSTAEAYNNYLGALATYTDIYNYIVSINAGTIPAPDDMLSLVSKREQAATKCKESQQILESLVELDAANLNIDTPNDQKKKK